jgi:isocitrate dehydrogenase (NAD+)
MIVPNATKNGTARTTTTFNPIATIFAGKMLLEYVGEEDSARTLQDAIFEVLKDGRALTYDLGGKAKSSEMGEAILDEIRRT